MAKARPLQCPFCDNYLIRPIDISFKTISLTGGICKCGAVYVLDRSGRNTGEAFMDSLVFVCKGDYDKAFALDPEEYESEDFAYDLNANTLARGSEDSKLSRIVFTRLKEKL